MLHNSITRQLPCSHPAYPVPARLPYSHIVPTLFLLHPTLPTLPWFHRPILTISLTLWRVGDTQAGLVRQPSHMSRCLVF